MKNLQALVTLIVTGLLLSPSWVFAQGGVKGGGPALNFDKAKFAAEVKKNFEGKAMGYQVVLLKNGQVVERVAGGQARNTADGAAKMTINTPANIGSTAKFFGGTALLHLFERPKGYYNPNNLSVNSWLNTEVYRYFPKVWKEAMHESIKQITFRDLLEHKSGFIQGDDDVDNFFDYLAKGVSNDPTQKYAYGKRNYANANFTLLGYVLPLVAQPHLTATLDLLLNKKKLKADDPYIQNYLGDEFESYMKESIFGKTTPKIYPSCDAPTEYQQKNVIYAKIYKLMLRSKAAFATLDR